MSEIRSKDLSCDDWLGEKFTFRFRNHSLIEKLNLKIACGLVVVL